MKTMFIDPFSGISGDMFLGALVDAGLPLDVVKAAFKCLNLPEHFEISAERVQKGSLAATLFKITLEEENHHHSHDDDHDHTHA